MDDLEVARTYRSYGGIVYARCVHLLRDKEAALDVTQEVFLRCFNRRNGLRTGHGLLAWLYRVATNLCLNYIRDRKFRDAADQAVASSLVGNADSSSHGVILDVLAGLDERTQAVAVYVYLDGMTHAEAAEVAGVSDRTVRTCLARFQEHGRLLLSERLPSLSKEGCG